MIRKIIINSMLVFILINIAIAMFGQATEDARSIIPSIPTSPQAEAFQKYGEYSINYMTGIPDISVPLYEVNYRGYKLPIVLKYYPQPLKPGYNYDVFGHGWGLSVNSCISRTIEYIPDEWSDFKLQTNIFQDYIEQYQPDYTCFTYYNLGYDNFHAILPNGTEFDFAIQKVNNALSYNISGTHAVKISCNYNSSNIQSFIVVDESGVAYTFSDGDTPFSGTGAFSRFNASNVSWQLTRIDLPNAAGSFTFNYGLSIESEFNYQIEDAAVKILHYKDCNPNPQFGPIVPYKNEHTIQSKFVFTGQLNNYKMKLLTSINYGGGNIVLTYQNPNKTNHNYVKKIQINDAAASVEVNLEMSEKELLNFAGGTYSIPLAQLDSITIKNPLASDEPQIYRCTYTNRYASFPGIDHWGFLNWGNVQYKVANFNLFVEFDVNAYKMYLNGITPISKSPQDVCPYDKIKLSIDDQNYDNRQPAPPDSHGLLSRLQFPTGGYTDFEFENHRFLSSTDYDGNYIYDPKQKRDTRAGGFRIKKITNYTADGKTADVKNFRYGKTYAEAKDDNVNFTLPALNTPNLHTGVGEAVVDPTILTYMDYSSLWINKMDTLPIRNMILGLNESGQHISFLNPFREVTLDTAELNNDWYWECTFSAANFRKLVNGRPPVIYPEVTVYSGDIDENGFYTPEKTNGKTVYKYDIYDILVLDTAFFEHLNYYYNSLSYEPKSYRYNILKEKDDYRFDGESYKLVNKEVNKWRYNVNGMAVTNYQYINLCPLQIKWMDKNYPRCLWIPIYLFFQVKSNYYGTAFLVSHAATAYSLRDDSTTLSEFYEYRNNFLLGSKTIVNSNGQTIVNNYYYPELNSNGTTPDVIQKMVEKHILSPVVNKITTVASSSPNGKEISGYKIDYKEFNTGNTSIIMPEKQYDLENANYVLKTQALSYTSGGNPQEVVTKDSMHTVYLWGYGDRYLIAEIKNATLDQVNSAVQSEFGMNIESLTGIIPDVNKLKNLRKNAILSNTQITTYTYGAWAKITSMTDPANRTTYYSYDGWGRLKESYYYENDDPNKKRTVEMNEYHFKD